MIEYLPDGGFVIAGYFSDTINAKRSGVTVTFADSAGIPSKAWTYPKLEGTPRIMRRLAGDNLLLVLTNTANGPGDVLIVHDIVYLIDGNGKVLDAFGNAKTNQWKVSEIQPNKDGGAFIFGSDSDYLSRWCMQYYPGAGTNSPRRFRQMKMPSVGTQGLYASALLPFLQFFPVNSGQAIGVGTWWFYENPMYLFHAQVSLGGSPWENCQAYQLAPISPVVRPFLGRSIQIGNSIVHSYQQFKPANSGTIEDPLRLIATDVSGKQLWHLETAFPGAAEIYNVGGNGLILQRLPHKPGINYHGDTLCLTLFNASTGALLKSWNRFMDYGRAGLNPDDYTLVNKAQLPLAGTAFPALPLPVISKKYADGNVTYPLAMLDTTDAGCNAIFMLPQAFTFLDSLPRVPLSFMETLQPYVCRFQSESVNDSLLITQYCAYDACSAMPVSPIGDSLVVTCGRPATFSLSATGGSWTWSNGATGTTVSLPPGRYSYTLTTQGCGSRTDSVIVVDRGLDAGMLALPDTEVCLYDRITLSYPYADSAAFWWFVNEVNAGSEPTLTLDGPALDTGRHIVALLRDNGACRATDSVEFSIPDPTLRLGWLVNGHPFEGDTVYFYDRIRIAQTHNRPVPEDHWIFSVEANGFDEENRPFWESDKDMRLLNNASTSLPGEPGCPGTAAKALDAIKVSVPNVLTPGDNKLNETLFVNGFYAVGALSLTVSNRWGKAIYQTGDYTGNWPAKGTPAGTYFLRMEHPKLPGGEYKGWVEVVK